jgi:hypothetical protein
MNGKTDQSAPKRPDSCPRCRSVDPKVRLCFPVVLPCNHPWHSTAATATPQTRTTMSASQALKDLVHCWDVFYSHLPDGEYRGLGGLRAAFREHRNLVPEVDVKPVPLTAEENQDDGRAVQGNQKYIGDNSVPTGRDCGIINISDSEVVPPQICAKQVPTDSHAQGTTPATQPKVKATYVGAPKIFALEQCCRQIDEAFGDYGCYLVGSALDRPDWRDVDVRFIMEDKKFAELFPDAGDYREQDQRWLLLTVAISEWLSKITGLPIDFQIQSQTHANARHRGKRSALGLKIDWKSSAQPSAPSVSEPQKENQ